MDANPEKFQCTLLGKDNKENFSIDIQGNTINPHNFIKVLGVTLDDQLNFNIHVTNICRIASRQINAFKRIAKHLTVSNRELTYKSFISSHFSYSPTTWIFCGEINAKKLEKLQERALRIVYKDITSSYESLLEKGNFLPLSIYRLKFLAIEVYKCIHGLNPSYLNELFEIKSVKYNLRDNTILKQDKFNTVKFGFKSFQYYGSKLWNHLPNDIKDSSDLYVFTNKLTKWCYTDQCKCLEIF